MSQPLCDNSDNSSPKQKITNLKISCCHLLNEKTTNKIDVIESIWLSRMPFVSETEREFVRESSVLERESSEGVKMQQFGAYASKLRWFEGVINYYEFINCKYLNGFDHKSPKVAERLLKTCWNFFSKKPTNPCISCFAKSATLCNKPSSKSERGCVCVRLPNCYFPCSILPTCDTANDMDR